MSRAHRRKIRLHQAAYMRPHYLNGKIAFWATDKVWAQLMRQAEEKRSRPIASVEEVDGTFRFLGIPIRQPDAVMKVAPDPSDLIDIMTKALDNHPTTPPA